MTVGSQADYENGGLGSAWAYVLAAKHPWHMQAVGKVAADHPEYLFARRDNRLILNIVDVDDPKFFAKAMMDAAVDFIMENELCAIFCNQGKSRSATIAMLAMAPSLSPVFADAEREFKVLYPDYAPAKGVRGFAEAHWSEYHAG